MKVSFSYGKNRDYSAKVQNINIRILHGSLDCRRSTGLEISLKDWDTKKHELANATTGKRSADDRTYLLSVKEVLDNINKTFESEFLQLKLSFRLKTMNKESWKVWCTDTLNKAMGIDGEVSEEAPYLLDKFQDYINYLVSDNRKPNTLKGYNSNLKMLRLFESDVKKKYRTDEIDIQWYYKLKEWNEARGNNNNYFGSFIQKTKAVINHFRSLDRNFPYHPNIDNKKFITIKENPSHDVLTPEQIEKVFAYKGKNYLENLRDLLIIQYYSCSRYNEVHSELTKGKDNLNIYYNETEKKWFWKILEEKTGSKTKIKKNFPVHKRVLDLYHSANFPHLISLQKYNKYIKELMTASDVEQRITSHTIRRTFCTNMWNNGHDAGAIMQYSGHSTEKQLRQYIQVKNVVRNNSIPTE